MEQEPENRITFLGQTNYRDHRFVFGIKKKDRRYHTYIIGQTGTGKSTLLENMIRQDVENGEGLAILDPHGDFAERIAQTVPEKRKEEFVFFDVPNKQCPFGFNPLESVPEDRRPLAEEPAYEFVNFILDGTVQYESAKRGDYTINSLLGNVISLQKVLQQGYAATVQNPAQRCRYCGLGFYKGRRGPWSPGQLPDLNHAAPLFGTMVFSLICDNCGHIDFFDVSDKPIRDRWDQRSGKAT